MKLTRITSDGRFIPEIDGLRFIAIMSVVLYHFQEQLNLKGVIPSPSYVILTHGFRGVQLFFVISGFILALPFARHALLGHPRVSLKQYFLRRLTRLEPPYVLSLCVCAAMILLIKHESWRDIGHHLLASMLYLHNIIYGINSTINGVAWSLEIEIQFYLLVPLIASVFFIRQKFLRRLVMVCAIVVSTLLQAWVPAVPKTIASQLQFFLVGFLLADVYLSSPTTKVTPWWDCAALLWIPVFLLGDSTLRWVFPFMLLPLYVSALRGRFSRVVFSHPLVTTIGGMCYSIYLWHFSVNVWAAHVIAKFHLGSNPHLYFVEQLAATMACVAMASITAFVLIERPCMDRNWPAKLWNAIASVRKSLTLKHSPVVVRQR